MRLPGPEGSVAVRPATLDTGPEATERQGFGARAGAAWQTADVEERDDLQGTALGLEYGTIAWNIAESAITVGLGIAAGSLALIGFGTDSLVEIFASLVIVWHMVPGHSSDSPQRTATALRLVGTAFLLLAMLLAAFSVRDLATGRRPEESIWGIAFLALTVAVMFSLAFAKRRIAEKLDSAPLRAEATMSLLDGFLATATLLGLAMNAWFGIWWADPAAALVISVAAINEARENWSEAAEVLEA